MDYFPIIQPEPGDIKKSLPLCREVAWDFKNGRPVFKNGRPVFVTGKEAVKVWAWKALITKRARYEIYSWNFGNEAEALAGQNFSSGTKRSEAKRYVREALEINPYITSVNNVTVDFKDSTLTIHAHITTIYGEADIFV